MNGREHQYGRSCAADRTTVIAQEGDKHVIPGNHQRSQWQHETPQQDKCHSRYDNRSLLAPKSGKETRKYIKDIAEIGVENASEAAQKAVKFVKKEAAAVKGKVNDLKTHMKNSKEIVKDAAEDLAEENKSKA
jgi:hypothetical protein